jgi:hypothetical protein
VRTRNGCRGIFNCYGSRVKCSDHRLFSNRCSCGAASSRPTSRAVPEAVATVPGNDVAPLPAAASCPRVQHSVLLLNRTDRKRLLVVNRRRMPDLLVHHAVGASRPEDALRTWRALGVRFVNQYNSRARLGGGSLDAP